MKISELSGRRLLLDTHVWLWFALGHRAELSQPGIAAIESAAQDARLFVSAASIWEIALKQARGDLNVSDDLRHWVAAQVEEPGIKVVPLTGTVAIESVELPTWIRERDGKEHRDPADRFLVATARRKRSVLLTVDSEILSYSRAGHVRACEPR